MRKIIKNAEIQLVKGDIADLSVDAIVNAANAQLILGSGVAGAIREKGGSEIQQECSQIGGTHVGGAVITTAGNLKAKFVIHAVGPRKGEGDEDDKLKSATLESLTLADSHGLSTIAFPAISTGIFGFPVKKCAHIMLQATANYLKKDNNGLKRVIFCLWNEDTFVIFERILHEVK